MDLNTLLLDINEEYHESMSTYPFRFEISPFQPESKAPSLLTFLLPVSSSREYYAGVAGPQD
jgi:hypothetical protein